MDRRQNTYIMDKGFKGRVSNPDVLLPIWNGKEYCLRENCRPLCPLKKKKTKKAKKITGPESLGGSAQEEQP